MGKYPHMYESASKGLVEIETMATPHLMNASRKLPADSAVRIAMEQELRSRGCTLGDDGRWAIPQAPDPETT